MIRECPLISVVTPSWNQGRYLSDCIRSVMELEVGMVEHIVVDNCSDDNTGTLIKDHPHLRVLIENDRGQSDALNKGIAMARGEWILWLNADDFLFPGTLEAYCGAIRREPNVDAVYGHVVLVDSSGAVIRPIYQPQWSYAMIAMGVYGMPSTGTLYRAKVLKDHPLACDFHMIMDTEWTLRNGRHLRTRRLRRRTVGFRVSEDNKTSANISQGIISPRHAEERAVLSQRYPWHGTQSAGSSGRLDRLFLQLARRAIRFRILADKIVSMLVETGFGR